MNMLETIAPKSDQLNADDLIGGPRTITVRQVGGNQSSPEQPVNVYFDGDDGKPFRPCKSMRRVMVQIWGPDAKAYAGRSMTLYRDPKVSFGGAQVGGIRISHMSHIDRDVTMALTASKAKRQPYVVKPLVVSEPPQPQQDQAAADPALLDEARRHANTGTESFLMWWKADKARARTLLAHRDELKRICENADRHIESDPFGLAPLAPDDSPPPDDVMDDGPGDDREMPDFEAELAERDAAHR
ncbi:MAG: hypothetical protein AAFR46_02770 [Pseudomonadota bacterium]